MRPISLILACLAPVVLGGLVTIAYRETPRQMRQENLSSYALDAAPMAPPGIVPPPADIADTTTPSPLKVSVPKIAYSYRYAFALPAASIVRTQEVHVALCDRLGTARCQLLSMSNGTGDDQGTVARLKLRVASAIARRFGQSLERSVGQAGGRAANRSIAAEDVSKDVGDTEARLRQRELLVARLTDILRTRRGAVAELVEAERSVAAAQEEIDQAKSWLGELQGRLAMSTIDVDYAATAIQAPPAPATGFVDTAAASLRAFVTGMSGVLTAIVFALPWLALLVLAWLAWRRWRPDWLRTSEDAVEAS